MPICHGEFVCSLFGIVYADVLRICKHTREVVGSIRFQSFHSNCDSVLCYLFPM